MYRDDTCEVLKELKIAFWGNAELEILLIMPNSEKSHKSENGYISVI